MNNKYYKWYSNIIDLALKENRTKGDGIKYERHHIVPKALGGTNEKTNLVYLTPKEHFICHHLLTKFTLGEDRSKMLFAFWGFVNFCGPRNIEDYKVTARVYSIIKTEIANHLSRSRQGENNPNFGKNHTELNKRLASERMLEDNPMKGRTGELHPNFGKSRKGIGGRPKGKKWSEEERIIHLKIRSKEGHYDYLKDPKVIEKKNHYLERERWCIKKRRQAMV